MPDEKCRCPTCDQSKLVKEFEGGACYECRLKSRTFTTGELANDLGALVTMAMHALPCETWITLIHRPLNPRIRQSEHYAVRVRLWVGEIEHGIEQQFIPDELPYAGTVLQKVIFKLLDGLETRGIHLL